MSESTAQLVERFKRHLAAIQAPTAPGIGKLHHRAYHTACARGLHKLLADRAVAGDIEAEHAALGAPHFLTFSDSTVQRLSVDATR